MNWQRNPFRAVGTYARELAAALGRRTADYGDEPPLAPRSKRAAGLVAAIATVRDVFGTHVIVHQNDGAVMVMRDGKQVHLGECRPRLLPAYRFDLVLPYHNVAIDAVDRPVEEIEFKRSWCADGGLHYISPAEGGLLAAKLTALRDAKPAT